MKIQKNKFSAIMLDMETLSTRSDAAIISIGACKFDPHSDAIDNEGFYASVSIDSNVDAGRHICESTISWWMRQSEAARKVFDEPKITLCTALNEFATWIDRPDYQFWSNGADFDIPMMAHAFRTHGMVVPWEYYNSNCFRTLKKMMSTKGAKKIDNPIKHNALCDAVAQARQCQEFMRVLKESTPV